MANQLCHSTDTLASSSFQIPSIAGDHEIEIKSDCDRESQRTLTPKSTPATVDMLNTKPTERDTIWEGNHRNPQTWPTPRKWIITILLSFFSFNAMMTSTMVAPALSILTKDLKLSNDSPTSLILSIYVLSYAFGFFVWAPLSELFGRRPILQLASTWFLVWNVVCGFAENEATMTVGRLFAGMGAAAALAISPGVSADVWRPEQRGRALAVAAIVPLLGPCIGPIIGAVISESSPSAWRYAFWATATLDAVLQILAWLCFPETHALTIQRHETQAKKTSFKSRLPVVLRSMRSALCRPVYLLATQPVIQLLAAYTGFAFGILYLILSVFTIAFERTYVENLKIASLNYLSLGIGMGLGAQICGPLIDKIYRYNIEKYKRRHVADDTESKQQAAPRPPPELRLYPFLPSILLVSSGLLVFGWTLRPQIHWIVPNIGMVLFGAGNQAMTQCTNAYIIDSFSGIKAPLKHSPARLATIDPVILSASSDTKTITVTAITIPDRNSMTIGQPTQSQAPPTNWSSSAMSGIWAAKSVGGFIFPLFSVRCVDTLGWGWTCNVLALGGLIIGIPVALVLLICGAKLRESGIGKITRSLSCKS